MPGNAARFSALNCITDRLGETFAIIYAVVHMLILHEDRSGFYHFIRGQLTDNGLALICSMGDGVLERGTDIATAFELQERVHEQSGKALRIAGTSYRTGCFEAFERGIRENRLEILKIGLTDVEPDYNKMMYAVFNKD